MYIFTYIYIYTNIHINRELLIDDIANPLSPSAYISEGEEEIIQVPILYLQMSKFIYIHVFVYDYKYAYLCILCLNIYVYIYIYTNICIHIRGGGRNYTGTFEICSLDADNRHR
jgi:hypothetical protein